MGKSRKEHNMKRSQTKADLIIPTANQNSSATSLQMQQCENQRMEYKLTQQTQRHESVELNEGKGEVMSLSGMDIDEELEEAIKLDTQKGKDLIKNVVAAITEGSRSQLARCIQSMESAVGIYANNTSLNTTTNTTYTSSSSSINLTSSANCNVAIHDVGHNNINQLCNTNKERTLEVSSATSLDSIWDPSAVGMGWDDPRHHQQQQFRQQHHFNSLHSSKASKLKSKSGKKANVSSWTASAPSPCSHRYRTRSQTKAKTSARTSKCRKDQHWGSTNSSCSSAVSSSSETEYSSDGPHQSCNDLASTTSSFSSACTTLNEMDDIVDGCDSRRSSMSTIADDADCGDGCSAAALPLKTNGEVAMKRVWELMTEMAPTHVYLRFGIYDQELFQDILGSMLHDEKYQGHIFANPIYMPERREIVNHLASLSDSLKLTRLTCHSAMSYYDRFCANHTIDPSRLHFIAIVCLFIAAKYLLQPIHVPHIQSFLTKTKYLITKKQFIQMEHFILKALNWKLGFVIPLQFIESLADFDGEMSSQKGNGASNEERSVGRKKIQNRDKIVQYPEGTNEYKIMCDYFTWLILLLPDMHPYRPSVVAASVLVCARHALSIQPTLPEVFQKIFDCGAKPPTNVVECCHTLWDAYVKEVKRTGSHIDKCITDKAYM